MSFNLADLSEGLNDITQNSTVSGVSFAKQALKLNSEKDASAVVQAIQACSHLEYLDLEGNTLGPLAAKAIAEALKKKGSVLKRALWKDMFTGRSKTEIPRALEYLGTALYTAGTQLVELDLSDNALGPIGVEGLAVFLTSSSCYTLRELRLNNNGLGIFGGRMLAKALSDCHDNSTKAGVSPLALRVFVAGRNRLENEGAKALAAVFKKFKTLEEVSMPQNSIYHAGIAALASGLSNNPGLRILNLNDNTVGRKGAKALAKALPNFQNLEQLNLGDCLLKTEGSVILTEALGIENNHCSLTKLNLSFNEINARGAKSIAVAMADKKLLTTLQLDGNNFGKKGRAILLASLENPNKAQFLSLNEDESAEEDGETEESESEGEDEEEQEAEEEENGVQAEQEKEEEDETEDEKEIGGNVSNFLSGPSGDKLLLLHDNAVEDFVRHAKKLSKASNTSPKLKFAEEFTRIVVRVSSFYGNSRYDVRLKAETLTDSLYSRLCTLATQKNQTSFWSNALLVNLGLIKSEDKQNAKIDWSLEGSFKALEKISQRDYFLPQLRDTLKLFLEKPAKVNRAKVVDPFQQSKDSLRAVLDRIQAT